MKHCPDCEPLQQSHTIAYLSVLINLFFKPVYDFMERYFRNIRHFLLNKFSVPFMKFMTYLNLGYLANRPYKDTNLRARCLWEEAERREIKMREFHLGPIRDLFIAEYKGKEIGFDGLPTPYSKKSNSLNWMDDKGIMKKKFKERNFPVAEGETAFTFYKALKIFNKIQKPVIAKPNIGSRGRHTTTNINTKEELKKAFYKAKKLSPFIMIEEELKGNLYRFTLVAKKVVGVVRKDPPQIIGNGINTVQELIKIENENEKRGGNIFHKIALDEEVYTELQRENIKLNDIIPKGKKIKLSRKISRENGGATEEITEKVHPDNIKLLEEVAKFLNNDIFGVDFIMEDATKSWKEQQNCGIIECNSLPFIDLHHYVMYGEPDNVAGKIWDIIFPQTKVN